MTITVRPAELSEILDMREMYRSEMRCQIIHDSIHARPGWTREYVITIDDTVAGYGSIAVLGPWTDKPTLYEFFVLKENTLRVFDLFQSLLTATGAVMVETQSSDVLLATLLHAFTRNVEAEAILFEDKRRTALTIPEAEFRQRTPDDAPAVAALSLDRDAKWVVTVDGAIAATGDILYHYNRPYGDIYMAVAEPYRRRGIGSWIVQELKRACYEGGSVPAARCNPANVASRSTLQKAGFVPCGVILHGTVAAS
jgi:GNAT superfamily N-acetyltransferase